MQNDAATILAELRQDHRNMGLMLDLLEQESNRIYEGEEPDYDLLHDIMHYMTVYPDAVHHPKEDRIYAELNAVRPDLSSGFGRITVDHRHIAELGLKLRDALASIASGAMVERKAVVTDALRYVNTLRGHMQWEELDLFQRIEEMIRGGHRELGAASVSFRSDPLFGPKVEARFSHLVESVREIELRN